MTGLDLTWPAIGQEEVDEHLEHLKDHPTVAPSGVRYCPLVTERLGDSAQCGRDQEVGRKKSFSKMIITAFPRTQPEFRRVATSRNFQ